MNIIKYIHNNYYRTILYKLILMTVFTVFFTEVGGFLPQRTARWWNKKVISLGPPISYDEKMVSLALSPLAVTPYSHRYLESPRLYEGDIYMSPNLKIPKRNENRRILRGLHTWPYAEVPYTIENTFGDGERLHVARAMTEIESKSCVRFVPRTDGINFIYIHKGKDCASNVGRIGGGQPISLAPRCIQFGIILHELLHALGFWHEQSRYDRRNYVDIHWLNIKPMMLPNFLVSPYYIMSDVGLPYDYGSIMHYASNHFARNPDRPTISPKEDGVEIGQRQGLSRLNAKGINLLYECEAEDYQSFNAIGFNYERQRELMNDYGNCLDLWIFCYVPRLMGGCWWGDYLMRRYCRKTCGLCP